MSIAAGLPGAARVRRLLPSVVARPLADLLPSVAAGAGVPGCTDLLGMDVGPRVCVLLVDGLGELLLREHAGRAPYLASLLPGTAPLRAGFPSTTATSMASLGTGLSPGQHGMLGYEVVSPLGDGVLNLLRWDDRVDPVTYQPASTVFERAAAAGVRVTRVLPGAFDGSGLTIAALRGGGFVAADSPGVRIAAATAALRGSVPALVYVYHGALDAIGHRRGCRSEAWRLELTAADRFAEELAGALPPGATLVITGDHGMLDIGTDRLLDIAEDAELDVGVRMLTGEPRARYVHTTAGAQHDVLACWSERLAGRATVLAREQAVEAGWFGSLAPQFAERVGDVVVVADEWAVVDSRRTTPQMLALIGMHGGRTEAEVVVPLLVDRR